MADSVTRRAALGLLALPLWGQRKLRPVDDSKQPDLSAFIQQLRDIVHRKDAAALLRIVLPDVKNDFGGDDGRDAFRRKWKLDQPGSEVFPLLERMLELGVVRDGDVFSMPYVYAKFPEQLDAFEYGVVTGERVWLRKGPSTQSEGLRFLSWDIVKLRGMQKDWWQVEAQDGAGGYVSARYVTSPVGYRAIFMKQNDGWKLEALVAGD